MLSKPYLAAPKLLVSALASILLTAGASVASASPESSARVRASIESELTMRSLAMLGVDYKWGGNKPSEGFDCSGLVRHVFGETIGRLLPRRSVELSREGRIVNDDALKPGDLVFFNTMRRAFSHVGIYIGEGQFVHAPSRGKQVRIDSMESGYWAARFNGARRLLAADTAGSASGSATAQKTQATARVASETGVARIDPTLLANALAYTERAQASSERRSRK